MNLKNTLGGGTYSYNQTCSICMLNYRWPFAKGDNPAIKLPDTQNDTKLDNIMDISKVVELHNCHHVFHRTCIDDWVEKLHSDAKKNGIDNIIYSCPDCRNIFIPDIHYIKVRWSADLNQDYIKAREERLSKEYPLINNMN